MRDLVAGKRTWSGPLAQDEIRHRFLGWHEGGYLPHRDEPGLVQFLTFRLADAWKGYTAKQANKILGCKGQFWQGGYWDTYMRDREHEARTRRYIENNPTKAKLEALAKEWPWCSARYRDAYQRLCLPETWRSAPVLGRRKHRIARRARFHRISVTFQHCCARGRAHPAKAFSRRH